MTFAELITELRDRGFEDMPATRRERYLNQAYQRICDRQAWPFLQAEVSGRATNAAPMEIDDLHAVRSVIDTTTGTELEYSDVRSILAYDPPLDAVGSPHSWYLKGQGLLAAYPSSGDRILVRYLRVPAALSEPSDEPLVPERFQDLIVDDAAARAHKSRGDYDAMVAVRTEFEAGIREMEGSMLVPNFDHPEQVGPSPSTDW